MGLTEVMVALHPKAWRERYGEEFAALLEDTSLTPQAVADVLSGAVRLHAQPVRRLTHASCLASPARSSSP